MAHGTAPRSRLRSWSGATVRPPAWALFALLLIAVPGGLVGFSATWSLLGEELLAVSLATLAGVGVAAGTVLLGGVVWTRRVAEV